MNSNATEAAELGYASRQHLPFALGAALDGLLGLDLLVAGAWIGELIAPGAATVAGVSMEILTFALGAGLLAWAALTLAFVWLDASRKTLWAVLVLNDAWVVATALLVGFGQDALSSTGNTILTSVAVAVGALAIFQFRALRAPAQA